MCVVVVATYSIFVYTYAKIEYRYVSVYVRNTYPSKIDLGLLKDTLDVD